LLCIYYCGGDCIEDIGSHLGHHLELRPNTQIPSPDTILRGIKELSCKDIQYDSHAGNSYSFNTAEQLNSLLVDMLLHTGQLKAGKDNVLDFDHQFIPTEKYDTKYSYKKSRGYFPGIASIGPLIVGLENRDANTNVRFHQADTLKRIVYRLAQRGVYIDRMRMDCGSYSKEIIARVQGLCNHFYIRALRYEALNQEVSTLTNWKESEINFQHCELTSIPFTAFMEEKNFRLIIQRSWNNKEADLFDGTFTYRCIVTNDWESSEEEIIRFYNERGASERNFDIMNNDFGWSHLPCSFMNENTAFLLLTAIVANLYNYLIHQVAQVFTDLEPRSRIKRFIFR
ncbi:MAG: IS1380 family transposase, partial [Phocaeicola sp.]